MAYQVLARGWRPQRFDEIIGQEAVVMTLKNALAAGRLGHAYLFSGLRGVGKTTAARLLAKAVNCAAGPAPEPCNDCDACREVAAGSSLDVVELDGASNRGIDDVRELRELLRYTPTRDRYRVIIIDEVHMLTREAFNALLKSLEEPPPYIIFILATTERQKVPATILSRCQQLEFRPVAQEMIRARLAEVAAGEGFRLSGEAAEMIARGALGSVRDALSLLDQLRSFADDEVDVAAVAAVLGVPPFERLLELIASLAAGDAGRALGLLRQELAAGHDPSVMYQEMGRALGTLVHVAVDPALEPSLSDEHQRRLTEMAAAHGAGAWTRMIGLWLEHEGLLREALNRELALEVACLRLARWPAVRQVEAILAGGGSSVPSAPEGSDRRPAETGGAPSAASAAPRDRLSRALWDADRPRLAGALERAEMTVDGDEARLRFRAAEAGLAELCEEHLDELVTLVRQVMPELRGVRVDVVAGDNSLAASAGRDPQVLLMQRVIGGEVVSVRADREPSCG